MKFLVPSHNPTALKAFFSVISLSFFQSNYVPEWGKGGLGIVGGVQRLWGESGYEL